MRQNHWKLLKYLFWKSKLQNSRRQNLRANFHKKKKKTQSQYNK